MARKTVRLWNSGYVKLMGSYGGADTILVGEEISLREKMFDADGRPTECCEFAVLHLESKAPKFVFDSINQHRQQSTQVRETRRDHDYWVPHLPRNGYKAQGEFILAVDYAYNVYRYLTKDLKIPEEIASGVLPTARYIVWQTMISVRALLTILDREWSPNQEELRKYTQVLHFLFQSEMPLVATAYMEKLKMK